MKVLKNRTLSVFCFVQPSTVGASGAAASWPRRQSTACPAGDRLARNPAPGARHWQFITFQKSRRNVGRLVMQRATHQLPDLPDPAYRQIKGISGTARTPTSGGCRPARALT